MAEPLQPPQSRRERFLSVRKARQEARERFLAGRKAEKFYVRHLEGVARQIGQLVRGIAPDGVLSIESAAQLLQALYRYAEMLKPWAAAVGERMIADVGRRDAAAWAQHGREIGIELRQEIRTAPTGAAMRAALSEQVKYITSLPIDAAERVHGLTVEALVSGARADEIAAEILRSGEVSKSRAQLIARTEVSRTATALTMARAQHIGSTGYIWRTSKDGAVRPSHKAMEGQVVRWDSPPTLDRMGGHAGQLPNCRCFPEVIIPDKL